MVPGSLALVCVFAGGFLFPDAGVQLGAGVIGLDHIQVVVLRLNAVQRSRVCGVEKPPFIERDLVTAVRNIVDEAYRLDAHNRLGVSLWLHHPS